MLVVVSQGRHIYGKLALALVALGLAGCIHHGRPVVAERSPVLSDATIQPAARSASSRERGAATRYRISPPSEYLVRKGDTLYSIAWRFELDHRSLARLNNIKPPYRIYPGQKLALKAKPHPVTPKRAQLAKRELPQAPAAVPKPAPLAGWVWPIPSKLVARGFSRTNKGIDFEVPVNSAVQVRAANSGEVVYAGNGIGGFERLIIVKHGGGLLSAYNFNGQVRADEKQKIKAGAVLADIKNNGRTSQKLHFELRNRGSPINPRSKLP